MITRFLALPVVATLLTAAEARAASPPATLPARAPTPDWIADPPAWRGFGADQREYAEKTAAAHVARWRLYRQLAMTPVSDDAAFRARLAGALKREAVFVPDVPSKLAAFRDPLPTTRPTAPGGPMDDATFDALASAVHDALVVLLDRPFDAQRERYFAGRVPRIDHPEADAATIEHMLGERVDVTTLSDAAVWGHLRRLNDKRRAAFGGGFNLRAAALDGPRGIACQIFYNAPGKDYPDGMLMARGNPTGKGWDDYWRAGLLVCTRQFTHPPIKDAQLVERDGRVLRAGVQCVLELDNGERAPVIVSLFYEPREGRWWVSSCCFSSSPYIGSVGQAR